MRALLLLLAAPAAALHAPAPLRLASVSGVRAAVTAQFFDPKKGKKREFFDDEKDTTGGIDGYNPQFADNGEVDLANVGGSVYLAFVPFLLFFLAYASGLFNFGYSKGNF
ncbi:MAG: hypothetical protein SGPRY_005119 [Prymnesium sp.]